MFFSRKSFTHKIYFKIPTSVNIFYTMWRLTYRWKRSVYYAITTKKQINFKINCQLEYLPTLGSCHHIKKYYFLQQRKYKQIILWIFSVFKTDFCNINDSCLYREVKNCFIWQVFHEVLYQVHRWWAAMKIKIFTEEEDKIYILSRVCGIEKITMEDFWTTVLCLILVDKIVIWKV